MVGSVMVGVLATKSADPTIARNGLAYGGGADQLLAQLLGVGVAALYSAVLTALILARQTAISIGKTLRTGLDFPFFKSSDP